MNRPDRLNAMSIELVTELYDALVAAGDDNGCRAIVLTGAGRAFSSGLDLKDYGVVPNIDGLQVGQIAQRSMRVYSRLVPLIRHLPATGDRRGEWSGVRRRHVPDAGLRAADRLIVRRVQRHGDRERIDVDGDGRVVPVAAA